MYHFDLRPFADHSVKVPTELLNSNTKTSITAAPLWPSLLIDGFLVAGLAMALNFMFLDSIRSFMVTTGLQKIFAHHTSHGAIISFPLLLLSYFFAQFYFNHGQSLGMLCFKKRLPVGDLNLKDSFRWSAICSNICLSLGLFLPLIRGGKHLVPHDYLYQDLLKERDISVDGHPFNLVKVCALGKCPLAEAIHNSHCSSQDSLTEAA